ncbi:MAG: CDP-alcohol phosphatidyltransferase family protein [Blastocatellia bacterium]
MQTTPIQPGEPTVPAPHPPERWWTFANGLTLLRIALLAPFLYCIKEGRFGLAVIVFFSAGISDFFDGYVARRFNQQSALGRFLDPAADKLLTTASYIVMALPRAGFEPLPLWMTVSVIGRDVLILIGSLVIYLTLHYKSFKPTTLGKVNTFLEIGLIFWFIIFQLEAMKPFKILLPLMYGIVITSVVASGIEYVWMGAKIFRQSGKPASGEAAN